MTIKKRYRQTDGTIVEALFTDDMRQVMVNNGEMKIWAPVDQEVLDFHQDTAAEQAAKKQAYAAKKEQLRMEIAHEKSDYAGIVVDRRAGTISYEGPIYKDVVPEVKPAPIEIIDLVEDPRKRRR